MLKTGELKKQLEARLAELLSEAKEIDSELREPLDPNAEERAVEMEDDEVLEGLGHAAVVEIGQIREALRRIEGGNYGTCARCGEDIGDARLEAVPHTAVCISCAGK